MIIPVRKFIQQSRNQYEDQKSCVLETLIFHTSDGTIYVMRDAYSNIDSCLFCIRFLRLLMKRGH
uniref:Uncharacterized protein n=1 Tax=Rhizophora mucronata TaxID=61149 RepID=A0A2P2KGF0_RHIMU